MEETGHILSSHNFQVNSSDFLQSKLGSTENGYNGTKLKSICT